jgi:hypothetical protein
MFNLSELLSSRPARISAAAALKTLELKTLGLRP